MNKHLTLAVTCLAMSTQCSDAAVGTRAETAANEQCGFTNFDVKPDTF